MSSSIPRPVLRNLREARYLTQVELARLSGYDERTVRSIEAGRPAQRQTLSDVCQALGVIAEGFIVETRPSHAETRAWPTSFQLRRLVNPDSICGYPLVGFDQHRTVFVCLTSNMVDIQTRLDSEHNMWLNTDYEHSDAVLDLPMALLCGLVHDAFGESSFSLLHRPEQRLLEFAFAENHGYYEVELQNEEPDVVRRARTMRTGFISARPSPSERRLYHTAKNVLDDALAFARPVINARTRVQ
jgi:transcriptional regulator with XRE-family HTH domain